MKLKGVSASNPALNDPAECDTLVWPLGRMTRASQKLSAATCPSMRMLAGSTTLASTKMLGLDV